MKNVMLQRTERKEENLFKETKEKENLLKKQKREMARAVRSDDVASRW